LAAELALSVASGSKAFGQFEAKQSGPVLFFGAEDSPQDMRSRFEAVAAARGISLQKAPIFLLDISELLLDDGCHFDRLRKTVEDQRPKFLVLDPFVRLTRSVDENSAQEVSAVLGKLRALQRDYDVAVQVVHHMRKSPSAQLGQRLRGSGDFAAWYDSALYIVAHGDDLVLCAEHRCAPAPPQMRVRLELQNAPHLVLEPLAHQPGSQTPGGDLETSVIRYLESIQRPVTSAELRNALKIRKQTLIEALERLKARGLIVRDSDGWRLASP
jgi:hypothetical protein